MKRTTKQPTKTTKNRITALILALILTATVLSPTIPVKAQETTAESAGTTENNAEGGGHQTGGDTEGGDSEGRPKGDAYFTSRIDYEVNNKNYSISKTHSVTGKGHFNVRTVEYIMDRGTDTETHTYNVYIFSDAPFTCKITQIIEENGSYYSSSSNSYEFTTTRDFGGKNLYYYVYELHYARAGSGKKVSHIPYFVSLESPNLLAVTVASGHAVNDYDTNVANTLNLSIDDWRDKENMTPVRDDSIGYLPRARYFDDRKKSSTPRESTATIQWDSFQEPYVSDLDNYYYVEIYADLHLVLSTSLIDSSTTEVRHHYKKYGEIKYVNERFKFPYANPFDDYLSSSGSEYDNNDILYPQSHVSAYYVRLVHYDYEKQQVLCGGWTKLTPNENGGCTSETGDFPDNNPSDDDDFVSDDDDPKEWDDTGWEPNPNPDDPDDPDDSDWGLDTSNIGAFIYSATSSLLKAFKSILSLVGEFPDLCKHVFSFLPEEVNTLMFGGVAAIVVMRFLGR